MVCVPCHEVNGGCGRIGDRGWASSMLWAVRLAPFVLETTGGSVHADSLGSMKELVGDAVREERRAGVVERV